MSYTDPAKRNAARRAADRKRTGSKAWHPGGPGRPPKDRGGVMEPQCKIPGGNMRADHIFGPADGLCACGARKMEFAPRPPLRPALVRPAAPKQVPAPARPAEAPPIAKPPARPNQRQAPADDEPAPGIDYRGVIAALELERDELEISIETLRRLQARKP